MKLLNTLNKHSVLILLFIFIFGDIGIYFYLNALSLESDLSLYYLVIMIFEIVVIYFFTFTSIIKPISDLKREIAQFLTGGKKGQSLEFSGANPEIKYIISFFNRSLEMLKNVKEEFISGKALKGEVELASEIQKNTLNKKLVEVPSLDIVANTKSASEVGGDSYDVIKQEDNYYIYIGDVTGHGVASGFVMMMVNALISAFSKLMINSALILAGANEILKPRIKSNMLMTLLMIRWDESTKKMYMSGAGHEYLLIYKKKDNKTYKIKSGGIALGMTKDISKILKEAQISVELDDVIVMYTDGITEARNGKKEDALMFGLDRLIETINKTEVKTAQGIYNSITIELSKFMGYDHRQFDDITLIVIHNKGDKIIENNVPVILPKENITEWIWD
ncbi:PP2C family protein-serine/threonine phosphatase [Candidatus Gracilibacteria bacterium]|nr:PP2C family protein-serine/threonine phosphatase [Candidatus Gracilibacteria bacterium]